MPSFIVFIISFVVILIINQIGYGGCFKSYCLGAAMPKVLFWSAVVTIIHYFINKK
ncbi:MAG: hypothetical protein ACJAUY_001875 [Cognaticolwellia sp.]|jgi:hypothetical protein